MIISPATRRTLLISFLLALATLTVYWPVRQFEFVLWDDDLYVTENPHVQQGLTWAGVRWAFTTGHSANWHPLTWLSLMADAELYGRDAGGFHLTNLLLHTANVVLLFLVLRRLTGDRQSSVVSHQLSVGAEAKERSGVKFSPITGRRSLSPDPLWPSAWVAALFALHPLHVESVAWVAERKDLLSALFGLLTLAAYGRYAASDQSSVVSEQLPKGTGRETRRSRSTANRSLMPPRRRWYALTLLCFTLGLLAKPMVVTLPFVLLLLDYWPLRRWPDKSWRDLVREKIPLFLFTAGSCWVTVVVQHQAGAVMDQLGLAARLTNAVVAYAGYLQQMIWPVGLACYYPHPGHWPVATVVGAGLVLSGLTWLAVATRRRQPAVAVGWCWYLGMLVPVIGLVQVGGQAMADRYTYLPLVGVWIALAWGLTGWAAGRRVAVAVIATAGVVALAAWTLVTTRQVPVWRNSRALFEHAHAVTRPNALLHNNLGRLDLEAGRVTEAIQQFETALRINPAFDLAHYNLALALKSQGRWAEAIDHFSEVVRINPADAQAHTNLGMTLAAAGRAREALTHYETALRLRPDYVAAHNNLGNLLARQGRTDEALAHYRQALRHQPDLAATHYNLGVALADTGRWAEAVDHLTQAVRDRPDLTTARDRLAQALQQTGRLREAAAEYDRLLAAQPNALGPLNNLAWLRATAADPALRDGAAAVRLAERAAELTGRRLPEYLDTLAAAYAEAGRWPEAVATAEQALVVAQTARQEPLATEIGARLEQYRARQPWRKPGR